MMDASRDLDIKKRTPHGGGVGTVTAPTASDQLIMKQPDSTESMDFEETESIMWRKHHLRRFFQDKDLMWTSGRKSTFFKWTLVVFVGVTIGLLGILVYYLTKTLTEAKFEHANSFMEEKHTTKAYFTFVGFCLVYAFVAGALCWIEPAAVGSGIPEVKAYLNGVNLSKIVRIRVLICKIIGMCFSCAASLPIGKEGPMIHCGAIVGAAYSQGKSNFFGFDTSWTKFQDLRNDRSKRDFVTFGAAAGVAAAFSAPIGGILFTLEEGASFWSTTLTFRAFFCAMVTQLVFTLITNTSTTHATLGGEQASSSVFAFGQFNNYPFYVYELIVFMLIGIGGGVLGALFNHINKKVTIYRQSYKEVMWKRMCELLILTFGFATICFIFPLMWTRCTQIPTDTANFQKIERYLVGKLVQFQCDHNQYNQVASLYFADPDLAMQQLFHFREVDGTNYQTFSTGALLMFFIPYFLYAAVVSGTFCPAGLFVPTLLSGAAYGRIIGHLMNCAFPGKVTNSGIYALVGAASILGGMSRMTIAGTVILLEASGSPQLLLPLMLTFFCSRYTGNSINESMYDLHIHLKKLPFLEASLKSLGLLNYYPVHEVMKSPVVCIYEISKVSTIYSILKNCNHNGFPVIDKNGLLRGFVLRKHLCVLLFHKAFSSAPSVNSKDLTNASNSAPITSMYYDTLEKNYPRYPKFADLNITAQDMNQLLDVRGHMDTAMYNVNESCSVGKAYRFFRSMGLRHLVVVDNEFKVTGIVTRHDIHEHRLEHHWFDSGDDIQKFVNLGPVNNSAVGIELEGGAFTNEGGDGLSNNAMSSSTQSAQDILNSSSISTGGISSKVQQQGGGASNVSSSASRISGRGVKEPTSKTTKDKI